MDQRIVVGRTKVFIFHRQPHHPMSLFEVSQCLQSFVQTTVKAIKQLHQLGFAHGDIRRANICFNADCEAVLIDFDRAVDKCAVSLEQDWNAFCHMFSQIGLGQDWDNFVPSVESLIAQDEPEFRVPEGVQGQVTVRTVLERRSRPK